MAIRTGGLTMADLLSNRFQTVAEFGESSFNDVITHDLAVHSALTGKMAGDLADVTTDRLRISGQSDVGEMEESNEWTRPDTQRVGGGATLGFPMRFRTYGLGWTRRWFQMKKVAEVAEQVKNAKKAHLKMLAREMKRAIYGSANYTFRDDLDSPILDLAVKRFANADSFPIPDGPNGETFDSSTHTHYTAAASLAAADITALVSTVIEHGHASDLRIVIAQANEAAFSALTGFIPFKREGLILGTEADKASPRLNIGVTNDRPIGFFGAATVWVKPWAIAGYAFCYAAGDDRKPLVMRTRNGQSPDLVVAAELEAYPMRAQYMESEVGVAVWNRTNGAVHQFTNGTYQNPTIN